MRRAPRSIVFQVAEGSGGRLYARSVSEMESSYVSRFTPGVEGLRVVVEGKDADGVPFQRVHAPLFTPAR